MPPKSNSEVKQLLIQVDSLEEQLQHFRDFLNNFDSNEENSISQLLCRYQRFEKIYDKYEEAETKLRYLAATTNIRTLNEFGDEFYDVLATAKKLIDKHQNPSKGQDVKAPNLSSSADNSQVKLPIIKLSIFDGNYASWSSYKDTFEALVNNNPSLPNIQKFYYLKSSLKDNALKVIENILVSDKNYDTAWKLLNERYENKKLLVNSHVKAIFNIPSINKESCTDLRNLHDELNKNLRALENLGQPTQYWDTLIIHIITSKFDYSTSRSFEEFKTEGELPTIDEIIKFLKQRCELLEKLDLKKKNANIIQPKSLNKTKKQTFQAYAATTTTNHSCPSCKENHLLFQCDKFKNISTKARFDLVKKLNLCTNCLKANHSSKNCRSTHTCKTCNANNHHTLLHFNSNTSNNSSITNVENNTSREPTETVLSVFNSNSSQVLLSTAIVQIQDLDGKYVNARCLLDNASQSHFISKDLCQRLKLPTETINFTISGISANLSKINQRTQVNIKSKYSKYAFNLTCLVIQKITDNVPAKSFDISDIHLPNNIELADPSFNVSNSVDILIGAQYFWNLILPEQIKVEKGLPILQNTRLGWIISGTYHSSNQHYSNRAVCNLVSNHDLNNQLSKFWDLENIVSPSKIMSKEELECEQLFTQTTVKSENNHFMVKLPFRDNVSLLGESKDIALKRFYSVEKRFARDPNYKKQYCQFMNEYESLGHMTLIEDTVSDNNSVYLPHHAVLKETSSTSPIRVVFDGSSKTTTGLSLNDVLKVGPTVQQDLFQIICRFRTHNIVLCADIAKMYRQIEIFPEDRNKQKILFRNNTSEPIKTYQLNTVTYGTASASFLATRSLYQVGIDIEQSNPDISEIIKTDFYVDDLLTGTNTIENAISLKGQLTDILANSGFTLRKWKSNLNQICELQLNSNENLNFDVHIDKVLGLEWSPRSDTLHYNFNYKATNHQVTKRHVLSVISKIYDPLGLLGPITITAKMIMQQLWQLRIDWDDPIPSNVFKTWNKLTKQLHFINQFQIPRKILLHSSTFIELHGFSDASEHGYGACLYLRSCNKENIWSVKLICSKSRVAPLKTITIPRLELCGALLLTQLMQKVEISLNLNITKKYCWTDSTIVLNWIHSDPSKWKIFVSNRVSQIHSLSSNIQWLHINTKQNPADILSRGVSSDQLMHLNLWWNGPSFLLQCDWTPNTDHNLEQTEDVSEAKPLKTLIATSSDLTIFTKYSSFSKLVHVLAYCYRFIKNANKGSPQLTGPLSVIELNNATYKLISIEQGTVFKKEIEALRNKNSLPKASKIIKLNPFLDEKNLLRVGGRIRHSNFSFEKKHPILLPANSKLTELIVQHYHKLLLHCGPQQLLYSLREKYWPISGRNLCRKICNKCTICFRINPKRLDHLMGDLPKSRVTPSFPFYNTGVDYAGPFLLRDRPTRNFKLTKAYVCIFVCFSTKAVHLEVVSDLTTEAFIATFRRFIARRGKPHSVTSDNGTNFVGAARELKQFIQSEQNQNSIKSKFHEEQIQWNFIPPRSPHMGGLWESNVKSFKSYLIKIVGNVHLTFEKFSTVLSQIEAVLNSRPLCPLSSSPDDLMPLTPAHFLIGRPLVASPDLCFMDIKENRLSTYQQLQRMVQTFWKRWSRDYINELQVRTKWQSDHPNLLQKGTLVIIAEDNNTPPQKWYLGRVLDLHPGLDSVIRVVTLKTQDQILKRPVKKLCVLPMNDF